MKEGIYIYFNLTFSCWNEACQSWNCNHSNFWKKISRWILQIYICISRNQLKLIWIIYNWAFISVWWKVKRFVKIIADDLNILESQLTGKDHDAGKDQRQKEKGMRWLNGIIGSMDMSLSKLQVIVKDRGAWQATVHGVANRRTRLSDWTRTKRTIQNNDLSSNVKSQL